MIIKKVGIKISIFRPSNEIDWIFSFHLSHVLAKKISVRPDYSVFFFCFFVFLEIFIFWDGIHGIHQLWVPKTWSQTGCLWWTEYETETTHRTQRPGFKIQRKLNRYFALKLWFIIDNYKTTILVNHHTLSSCQKDKGTNTGN